MGEDYWKEIVLPSVQLPDKATYNFYEARTILGCGKTTLWRIVKNGDIKMSPSKKFYRQELINYLCSTHPKCGITETKP